jgi:hypothetical protein
MVFSNKIAGGGSNFQDDSLKNQLPPIPCNQPRLGHKHLKRLRYEMPIPAMARHHPL